MNARHQEAVVIERKFPRIKPVRNMMKKHLELNLNSMTGNRNSDIKICKK